MLIFEQLDIQKNYLAWIPILFFNEKNTSCVVSMLVFIFREIGHKWTTTAEFQT